MKVRIVLSFDVNDELRRAINARFGQPGLASRADLVAWYTSAATSMDDDALADYIMERQEEAERAAPATAEPTRTAEE